MHEHRHGERARSFGRVADDYEAGRPTYPRDAVEWVVGDASLHALDLAAGTGKLTRQLVELGHEVTAVEPLVPMLERLHRVSPGAHAIAGVAEALPLRARSVDAVTVGQALHWFDLRVALSEIARVLRTGGVLGLVWNIRDKSVGWVRELFRAVDSGGSGHEGWREALEASALFGPLEERVFRMEQMLDLEGLLALVRSRSHCSTLADERRDEVLESVRLLWRSHPELAASERFALPYLTHAYRAPLV